MTFTRALSTNNYGPAKFIVDGTTTANGTHSTIAAALTSASSGDTIFIRPGTYTENLTLKAGVNLTSYACDSSLNATGKVIISGTCTFTATGSVTISGIQLQTNSAALLAVTGSSASSVNLVDCYLNCTNNTGITFSSSSASASIYIYYCEGNLGTTGIAYYSHSSAGTLEIRYSKLTNSGNSTTNNTQSAGSALLYQTTINSPITTSSTAGMRMTYVTIDVSSLNTTCVTYGGSDTGTRQLNFCRFLSGTASAISISSTMHLSFSEISSSNTNAITGTGTLRYSSNYFTNTSSLMNSTLTFDPFFENGSITNNLKTNGFNPADSTTYYFEYAAAGTSPTLNNVTRKYITRYGTLKSAYGFWDATAGSAENVTIGINVNGTTSYNISTTVQMNAASGTFNNTSLNIPLAPGDYIGYFMTTPAWVTNPTNVGLSINSLIE